MRQFLLKNFGYMSKWFVAVVGALLGYGASNGILNIESELVVWVITVGCGIIGFYIGLNIDRDDESRGV